MRQIFQGRVLHCKDKPGLQNSQAVEYLENGILVVENGKITDLLCEKSARNQGLASEDAVCLGDKLLVPGFLDTHVHAPQMDVIASYGKQLLDWLQQYTFPAEMRFADPEFATIAMAEFVDELLKNGTTTALVFSTSHEQATEQLFRAAQQRNICLIGGKVLMDRNAPAQLCDTADSGYQQSRRLIENWHGVDRLSYAVTPRFSITSSPEQLRRAGQLMTDFDGLYMQTHLSENTQEIAEVMRLFPDAENYLATYDRYGLCTDKSFFAHSVHMQPREIERLKGAGAKVAFCPSSNLFLGSGLFDWQAFEDAGIDISLASDVGAGLSLSMLHVLSEAYKVCQLRGMSLDPMTAFYSITLGNARALGLEQRVGNLAPGSDADFLILDPSAQPGIAARLAKTDSIEQEWFSYMMLGDQRLVSETWVAGKKITFSPNSLPTNSSSSAQNPKPSLGHSAEIAEQGAL